MFTLLTLSGLAFAQGADPRVAPLLDELGLVYTVDEDNDYKLILSLGDRTQIVYISTRTNNMQHLEVREVWAPAFRSRGRLKGRVANALLYDNTTRILGAWHAMPSSNGFIYATFVAKVAAEMDAATLGACILAVAETADDVELRVTGKDDY